MGRQRRVLGMGLISCLCALAFLSVAPVWGSQDLETARRLITFGRYQDAARVLRQITSQSPDDTSAHLLLGDLYLRFQAYPQASAEYQAVLSGDPKNFHGLLGMGTAARQQGDLKRALAFFRKAVQVRPGSIPAHWNLALLYDLMGDFPDAAAEYTLLARLDPNSQAGLFLARLYLKQKQPVEAARKIQDYLNTHPQDGEGWNALAEILQAQHKDTQALSAAGRAVSLSPRNVSFLLARARLALDLRSAKYAKMAAADAKTALALDPSNAEANRILLKAEQTLSARRLRIVLVSSGALVLGVFFFLAAALRRKEERQSQKSGLVEQWGKELAEINDHEEILQTVFARLSELFNLPKGMFFVMNREETVMSCAFTNYKVILSGNFEVKKDAVSEWHAALRGRPMTTTQAFRMPSFSSAFPDCKRLFEKHDLRLLVPFFAKNKLLAMLGLGGISRREFRNRLPAIRGEAETGFLYAEKAAAALETSTLYELSMLDEQTQVFNKRFFTQVLSEEIRRVEHYQQPFSLLMLDIDYFKQLNDTFGHPLGDSVLRELAGLLRDNVRQGMDTVFRYGGEEFTVILPAIPADKARETAERIRQAVAHHSFSGLQPESRVTVSIGVASYPDLAKADWELIQAADQALYKSKAEGRNRVTVSEGAVRAVVGNPSFKEKQS